MQKFFVYIIYSPSKDRYYVGQTQDLEKRLQDHCNSRSGFTKSVKDWKLVYFEEFETRSESVQREVEIKKKKSRKYIEYLIAKA